MPEASKTPSTVRFGPFELSTDTGELRKNGIWIKLFGQPIKVLTLLVSTPGQVVTREQLQKSLWPGDTFGDFERGLNAAVNRLRENLGDSATEPTYIETVPGRGYRFIGLMQHPPGISTSASTAISVMSTMSTEASAVRNHEAVDSRHQEDTSRVFSPPCFRQQVLRPSVLQDLDTAYPDFPIVTVEGLPGAGKTYVAASFVSSPKVKDRYRSVLWHDPHNGELLDTFLADLSTSVRLVGSSPTTKCKALVNTLIQQNMLLVIDDFQSVDTESFSILISAASRIEGPARLLILSRTFLGTLRGDEAVGHVVVRGFELRELRAFLVQRGVSVADNTLDRLLTVTDGLPLAASLFTTLVRHFNRNPEYLLKDKMMGSERLKKWFAEIETELRHDDKALLVGLSLWREPFNASLPNFLKEVLAIQEPDVSFERIQRMYLVQAYSKYRWAIHSLIAVCCTADVSSERAAALHVAFARYASKGISLKAERVYSDQEFGWLVLACKHFQEARNYTDSERILHAIAKTAKLSGNLLTYIQLARIQIAAQKGRDTWLDYHLAHSYHISGQLSKALSTIGSVAPTPKNPNKTVACARLFAEILGSMGDLQGGYARLSEGLASVPQTTKLSRVVLHQALSTKVWLLTRLGRYDDADALLAVLRDESVQADDTLGIAINATRAGILQLRGHFHHQAVESFSAALLGFKQSGYHRGRAWCLAYMAMAYAKSGRRAQAVAAIKEAMHINSDAQSCSIDYYDALAYFADSGDLELTDLVSREYNRVRSILLA